MNKGKPTNIAASVHSRLLNLARAGGRSFNDLFHLYAMERFLYRLSKSEYESKFLLKGALLLRVWDPATFRTTRDIDLLGNLPNKVNDIVKIIQALCRQSTEVDGMEFDPSTVEGDAIIEEGDYHGVRAKFLGHLGAARANMQIDVGFGDALTLPPSVIDYPVLLDFPAPRLSAYLAETVIAEKFEIMLKRGAANTRMKDYHDIWWLAQSRGFDGSVLASAMKATCERRGTRVTARPEALTSALASDPVKIAQWRAFYKRIVPTNCPEDFATVVDIISEFIGPIASALATGREFTRTWPPRGPWK